MLIPVLSVIAAVVVVFVISVSLRPGDFQVSRSLTVAAPAADVFPHVNDLRLSAAWNPWIKLDPNIRLTYEGPETGVGASSSWDGNNNVGAGRQTIVESRPSELVRLKLEFFRPCAGVNEVWFTLKPSGGQTEVTWNMTGKLNFMMKAMGLFMSMDKMCGDSFEKGLADLKAIVAA